MRTRLVVVAVLAAALAMGACSKSKKPPATAGDPAPAAAGVAFSVSSLNVEAGKPPAPGSVETARAEVLGALNRYLDAAVLTPLRTGGPAGDLGPVVTGAVYGRLGGPDKPALVDEGLPRVDRLRADAATLAVTVLAGQSGEILMASAAVDLKLDGSAEGTPVRIQRTGEFVLLVENGTWRIDGYHIRVTRDTAAGTTTSTAKR